MIAAAKPMDRIGPRPLYEQIAAALGQEVRERHAPGDRLPCEDDLVARFAVNRHTLRHAIDILITEGLLERRRGVGTFVAIPPLAYLLHREARFTETLQGLGRGHASRILRRSTVAADAVVAERLRIDAGATLYRIDTVRSVDDGPISLITHWLPCALLPDLAHDYEGGSLHGFLHERYGLALRRTQTVIAALLPTADDARQLGIPRQQPVLRLSTVNVEVGQGTPIEFAISRCRADRMEVMIDHDLS